MGSTIFSTIACELGMIDKAWDYFKDQFAHFHEDLFYNVSESPHNTTWPFTTGLGGFMMNLLYGFGGLRIRSNGLLFAPILPKQIPELLFHQITYNGIKFEYQILNGGKFFTIKNLSQTADIQLFMRKSRVFKPKQKELMKEIKSYEKTGEISFKIELPINVKVEFELQ
jgi:trehalose/maltose hydrolase-like predicted phosphorylase